MTSPSGKLLSERNGRVAIIRFNDPATRNALTMDMADELKALLREAEESAGAVMLAGGDKAFCAGANLGSVGSSQQEPKGPGDAGLALEDQINPLMMAIRDLSIPIVTAVRGAAAGVGASLALAGDLIVAGHDAYFLQAFAKIGLVPDGGSPWLLVKSIGKARAMELMLLADRLPAEKAADWGLINQVVEDSKVEGVALALANRLADGPSTALGLIRKACWSAAESSFDTELRLERVLQRQAGRDPNFAEGVSAFLEKRPARFNAS